jgi:hypothetical protein
MTLKHFAFSFLIMPQKKHLRFNHSLIILMRFVYCEKMSPHACVPCSLMEESASIKTFFHVNKSIHMPFVPHLVG